MQNDVGSELGTKISHHFNLSPFGSGVRDCALVALLGHLEALHIEPLGIHAAR